MPRIPKPRQVEEQIRLLPLTAVADLGALPWKSEHLKIAASPTGSVQIYGGTLTGLSADIYVTNIPKDLSGKKIATLTAEDVVAWGVDQAFPPAAYLQVVITALDPGGKVGIEANVAAQAGA